MSAYEQPFSHFEERYFLAEILKRSNLPPELLFAIIRDHRVEPAWNDIALPHGRSVSACQQAYQNIAARTAPPPPQPSPIGSADFPRGAKRPYSSLGDANTSLPSGRELQPRPPGFTGMNGQQVIFPPPAPMTPVAPQRKKRGRPTKAEWERRAAEAQERGEIWPKPRKAKARPSTEAAESSKGAGSGTARAAVDSAPAEASASGAAAAAPSPDASRSVSGGPVQQQLGSSYGPESSGTISAGVVASGPGQLMEGIQQHGQSSTQPVHQSTSHTSPRIQGQGDVQYTSGNPMQAPPQAAPASHDSAQEQRSRRVHDTVH